MTVQLTKAQIDAIKVELAKVGLSVTVARKAVIRGDGTPGNRPKHWHGYRANSYDGKLSKPYPNMVRNALTGS
jgi:hypothetical protein